MVFYAGLQAFGASAMNEDKGSTMRIYRLLVLIMDSMTGRHQMNSVVG